MGQGCRFAKWVVGAEPVETAQNTIINLQFNDFSSDLTHFLAQVKDFRPFLTQVVGAQAPTTEYETTPLEWAPIEAVDVKTAHSQNS